MQWLKKLFSTRCESEGVFVGGKKWNPRPLFGDRLRGKTPEMTTEEQRLACIVDPRGNPEKWGAVVAICREESSRLRAQTKK